MRTSSGLLLVVALLLAAPAFGAEEHKEELVVAEKGFGILDSVISAATSIIQKAVIVAKTQALVVAIKGASSTIGKLPDEVITKEINDKISKSAEGLVKQTDKDANKLANKGIDRDNAGADKKPKPAFIEVAEELLLEASGEFSKQAREVVGNDKVKAAIADLASSMVTENSDTIKLNTTSSVSDLTDKITTALVSLFQRASNDAKKISSNNGVVAAIGGAISSATNRIAQAASSAWNAVTGRSSSTSSKARFRRVFARQKVQAATSFTVELSAKSYIRPVSSSGCWVICPDVFGYVIDPICSGAAIAFCASMGPMGVTTDSESYGSLGNARLYSKHTFRFTCENGHVTAVTPGDREGAVGKEGPLQGQPPSGDYDRIVARVDGGVAHFGYMFSGRPNRLAEPGFQALRFRTCTWIWHFPYFKINSCQDNGAWNGEYQFGGSNFPTRRLWQNGREIDTINQGRIDALWSASSADRALVDGWFPYDFSY